MNAPRATPILKLYHAEPVANSLKSLIPLHEKKLPERIPLHEQREKWRTACNQLFIISHPEFRDVIHAGHAKIEASIARDPVNAARADSVRWLLAHEIYTADPGAPQHGMH